MNLEVLYTQHLPPTDSNHDFDTSKYELWKKWFLGSRYFYLSLKVENKVFLKSYGNLSPYGGIYKVLLLGLSDLSQQGLGHLIKPQMGPN